MRRFRAARPLPKRARVSLCDRCGCDVFSVVRAPRAARPDLVCAGCGDRFDLWPGRRLSPVFLNAQSVRFWTRESKEFRNLIRFLWLRVHEYLKKGEM